jgi:hypothetical protein
VAVTAHVFPQFIIGLNAGNIKLTGGTYKVALGNAAGPVTLSTSGIAAATLFTDWTAIVPEITGTGYTAGGATMSGLTFTAGGTNSAIATWTTGTNPSWTSATFSYNQAVMYESSASTNQLICFWDFGGSQTVTASTLTLTISPSGLLAATAS